MKKSELEIRLFEDAGFDADAMSSDDEIDIYALNRELVKHSGVQIWKADPVTAEADSLLPTRVRGHSGGGPAGGRTPISEIDNLGWILKANSKYGLVLKNTGGESIDFLELVWAFNIERNSF